MGLIGIGGKWCGEGEEEEDEENHGDRYLTVDGEDHGDD